MSKDKNKRPWGGFGYLVIVVIAILVAWFLVLPVGMEIRDTFQQLTNALSGK
jgi:ABC-type transporter Mla subunit MlaD